MTATAAIPPAIIPGLEATVEKVVPHEWTIAHFRGILPAVLSTPAMIGMMPANTRLGKWCSKSLSTTGNCRLK